MENALTDRPTDGELVQGALAGSQAAFHGIVDRYQVPAQRFAARIVHDCAVAEDLTQEAFARAFGRLSTYDRQRQFCSWLFKIVRNVAVDYLRVKRPVLVSLETLQLRDSKNSSLIALGPSPYRQVELTSLSIAVNLALAQIKPEYRNVVLMRYREELSLQEISLALGLRVGTVAVYLHRAKKELAHSLPPRGNSTRSHGTAQTVSLVGDISSRF
jgi:RNA polymerase sigma-70 factor (ECF subfamily)